MNLKLAEKDTPLTTTANTSASQVGADRLLLAIPYQNQELVKYVDPLDGTEVICSEKRSHKIGKIEQQDPVPIEPEDCICCFKPKPPGSSLIKSVIPERVSCFENDCPFGDKHRVLFLHHPQASVQRRLHLYRLQDLSRLQLYYLLKGAVELLKEDLCSEQEPNRRMCWGINIGELGGMSLKHFHSQVLWDTTVSSHVPNCEAYLEAISAKKLTLFERENIKLIVPWAPKSSYALELWFTDSYLLSELRELDLRVFALFAEQIARTSALELNLKNMNIVARNSVVGSRERMVSIGFQCRSSLFAWLEFLPVLVVDTNPEQIAQVWEPKNWDKLFDEAKSYSPEQDFFQLLER